MQTPETEYVYVITRLDIPQPHRTVQVAHGILAATNTFGNPDKTHPHLVVCAVTNEDELTEHFNRLKELGVPCLAYYEADMDNKMTAVATAPIVGAARKALRQYRLLSG